MFSYLQGRSNRVQYWLLLLLVGGLAVGARLVLHSNVPISELVLVMVCVPRLHDIGRSGWWMLILAAVEAAVVAGLFVETEPAKLALEGAIVLLPLLLILLGALPGQKEANRFGPPPAPGLSFKPAGS